MPEIVLASASAYRKCLLERLGLAFSCDAAHIDESPHALEAPLALVRRLCIEKAVAVAVRHADSIVIGSDQLGVMGDTILGKPGSVAAAVLQLQTVSGREVRFLTGLCVLDTRNGRRLNAVEEYRVRFRRLELAEIVDYIEREQPLDCAGSFKVEGLGIALFDKLTGDDPTALEGLPLIRLTTFLGELGVPVLAKSITPTASR